MLERVSSRTTNDYGKTAAEREEIRSNRELVEPLLRASADVVIDTSLSTVDEIVERLIAMVPSP
jgi:cytidylate kinase